MIEILDEGHYLEFVQFPPDAGWNSTTHLAQIDFGDGRARRAYVKLTMDAYPAVANEALGWMLARALELRTPERAAILLMTPERFEAQIGPLPDWAAGRETLLLWCSQALAFKSLRFLFRTPKAQDKALAALMRSKAGRRIAAMACFTGHIDTNPGNLLKVSADEYVTIDHEHLFNASDWRRRDPDPCADTYLLQWLTEQVTTQRIKLQAMRATCSEIALHGERHEPALGAIRPFADELLADLTTLAAARRVLQFLAERSTGSWLRDRLGILDM